jgi:hypothetical protein
VASIAFKKLTISQRGFPMEGLSPQTAEKTTPASSSGGVFSAVTDLIKKKGIETVMNRAGFAGGRFV